jgi:proline-specific peptidase
MANHNCRVLTHPSDVASLTLASTSASLPQFVAEAARLKAALPPDVYATLQRYEAVGDYHHVEYEDAVWEFYQRHLCRLPQPWPDSIQRTGANLANNPVYETMNGPNEFMVIGNLKDWDRTDHLGEITVPTLITVGRYDEITPACAETLHQGIPHSQMVILEQSAHMAHIEEPDKYLRVVADFLAKVEAQQE